MSGKIQGGAPAPHSTKGAADVDGGTSLMDAAPQGGGRAGGSAATPKEQMGDIVGRARAEHRPLSEPEQKQRDAAMQQWANNLGKHEPLLSDAAKARIKELANTNRERPLTDSEQKELASLMKPKEEKPVDRTAEKLLDQLP